MASDIPFHQLANIFPLLEGIQFRDLVEDIRVNGLQEPIVLFEGAILDGRNRARACQAAQVAARYKTYDGRDPLAFVVSANLHRRHLDVSQRAMIAARISERMSGRRKSGPSSKLGAKISKRARPERYVAPREGISGDDAAKLLNVSSSSVGQARKVLERGAAELITAVDQGEIAASAAAMVSSFGQPQQLKILAGGSKVITILAREDKDNRRNRAEKYDRAAPLKASSYLRIGDGRQIGMVRYHEIEGLVRTLRLSARVLELISLHIANGGHKRVTELVTENKLLEFVAQAECEIVENARSQA